MDIKATDSENLPTDTTQNEHFQTVVNRAVSRRGFLKFGTGAEAATFFRWTFARLWQGEVRTGQRHYWGLKPLQPKSGYLIKGVF